MTENEPLIPKHGGYRNLKSFQLAQLVYDVTVRFCDRYIDRRSRTRDQMVQAARSGVQNIAEGSQASATSKKTELKLTNVARASLEELRLDYEDFLRQRGLPRWEPEHPALKRFKVRRCASLEDVRAWVEQEKRALRHRGGEKHTDEKKHTDEQGRTGTDTNKKNTNQASVPVSVGPCASVSDSTLAANAALSLLNLCCFLFDRQLLAQAKAFETEGGFTERLYRVRSAERKSRIRKGPR
jgi:four helix bundle suffix protein